MTARMKPEIKAAWVHDLKYGHRVQTVGRLGTPKKELCCLGDLALILDEQFPEILTGVGCTVETNFDSSVDITEPGITIHHTQYGIYPGPLFSILPDQLWRVLMEDDDIMDQQVFSRLNDAGITGRRLTFWEIAEEIEREL